MKKPKKRNEEDLNFWQPTSDLLSGLVYILMLVIVLLGLYLMQLPEFDQPYPDPSNTLEPSASPSPSPTGPEPEGGFIDGTFEPSTFPTPTLTPSPTPTPTPIPWEEYARRVGGGGGGDGGGGRRETPHPTYYPFSPSPSPSITPIPNGEEGGEGVEVNQNLRAAVSVMLVDAETEQTVKDANVQFELYGERHVLQVFNVYYPQRISYRSYETSEDGTFFFPEKLQMGTYELHEMTEPEGYDVSSNIEFELLEEYDWADPLVVKVPVYPSRNIIRVQMTDSDTGANISGGGFDILAADNIVTLDGTLRYRAGQVVGQILCNETGYGESEELFLGEYLLRQSDIPEYYASLQEDTSIQVERSSSAPPPVNNFPCERTRITVNVSDELYPTRMISNAEFSVIPSKGLPYTATSDHLGRIIFDEVSKNTSYRVRQTAATGDYLINPTEYSVNVAQDGRIDGEAAVELNLTNRIIRVSISLTDEFSSIQVPGVSLSLYSAENELLHTWTTTGVAQTYTDLTPGQYVIVNPETEQQYDVTVLDQAEMQTVKIYTAYVMHYLLYGAVALGLIIVVIILIILIRKKRRKKKAARSGKE